MSVAVTRRQTTGSPQRVELVFLDSVQASPLTCDVELGAGVAASIDLLNPTVWLSVRVREWDDDTRPLLDRLIGSDAVKQLERRLEAEPTESRAAVATDGPAGRWTEVDVVDSPWPDEEFDPGAEAVVFSKLTASVTISHTEAEPWLRIAEVDALDRWLHLPLDQRLVDAERAVVRVHAARELPEGPARTRVIAEALGLARGAARGLAPRIAALGRDGAAVGPRVVLGLSRLVDGYRALLRELPEPDGQLQTVISAGRHVLDAAANAVTERAGAVGAAGTRLGDTVRARLPSSGQETTGPATASEASSVLDPRQTPARVLAWRLPVAADGALDRIGAAEVHMRATRLGDEPAIEVEVPAVRELPLDAADPLRRGAADRLLVRLIDRRTGRHRGEALLTLEPAGGRPGTTVADAPGLVAVTADAPGPDDVHAVPVFRAVVPIEPGPRATPQTVRADVFDALVDVDPAARDDDPALRAVREEAGRLIRRRSRTAPGALLIAELVELPVW